MPKRSKAAPAPKANFSAVPLPDIWRCPLDTLWFESKRGKRRVLTPKELKEGRLPSAKKYPYAFSRFPLSIETKIYRRREKDGGYGSRDLLAITSATAPGDLAQALAWIYENQISLGQALIIASSACERCKNILAWQCGLKWGYRPDSREARACNTSCRLCRKP